MKNALVKLNKQIPEIPESWDYDESINKTKGNLYKWRNITEDIIFELWVAREILSAQGKRTDLGSNKPRLKTWAEYCQDIEVPKSTANRWLANYNNNKITDGSNNPSDEVETCTIKASRKI